MFKPSWMVLYQNPTVCNTCNQKFGEPENAPDVLDDPFVIFSNCQGGNDVSSAFPESLTFPEVSIP